MPFDSHAASELSAELSSGHSDTPAEEQPGERRAAQAAAEHRAEAPPADELEPETELLVEEEPDGVAPLWLQRLSLLVLVLFCVYLGVLVAILPWWTRVWDNNMFINSHPALAAVLHLGAVRGLVTGLGLLDIWIGVSEAIHYRDHRT
jgi:hypothetical protein